MSTTFLGSDIWSRITRLSSTGRAYVAVAYCQSGARNLLPLRSGSVLVVDASEHAVKTGQTNPAELMKFVREGVSVHSAQSLHAKVFAFPRHAVVGSTNASSNSVSVLREAALQTTEPAAVAAARRFVLDHSGEQLTIPRLEQLERLYQPPRFMPQSGPRAGRELRNSGAPLWLARMRFRDWGDDLEDAEEKGRPAAQKRLRVAELLDEFEWSAADANNLALGDQVVQIVEDEAGELIFPPSHVISIKRLAHRTGPSRRAIVFVAAPAKAEPLLVRKLKPELRQVVSRVGIESGLRQVRNADVVHALRQLWRPS